MTEENDVRHRSAALTRACVVALLTVLGVLGLAAAPASAATASGPVVWVTGAGASARTTTSLGAAKVGQIVDVRLAGFGAATQVLVSIGPAALPRLVTTDRTGSAVAVAVVPKLPTDDYLVTAASRGASASVALHVTAVGKVVAGSTVVRWYAPVSTESAARAGASVAAKASASAAASAVSASRRRAAVVPSTPPTSASSSAAVTPSSTTSSGVTPSMLAALPAASTSTPAHGWLALGSLLALALGGSVAALAWGLRRDAEVESLGRHARLGAHSAPEPDLARE